MDDYSAERKMMMKRRVIVLTTVGLGMIAGYMFGKKDHRTKIKNKVGNLLDKMKKPYSDGVEDPLINAGIPDQTEHFDETKMENTKMVSEGSQYGVHYYNEWQEKEDQEEVTSNNSK